MPRARSPDRDKAFELYKAASGNIKLRDIAEQLGVPEKTISAWKVKDKWGGESNGVLRKNTEYSKRPKPTPKADELGEALEENHKLFAEYYVEMVNLADAWMRVNPNTSRAAARVSGWRVLQKPEVAAYVAELKEIKRKSLVFDAEDIIDRWFRIAFADITSVADFGVASVPVIGTAGPVMITDPATGEEFPMTKQINEMRLKSSYDVDGTIINQIKVGKDGTSVKLEDRLKAQQCLMDYFGWNPEHNRRAEFEKRKLELQERQIAAQERKTAEGIPENPEDDNLFQAIEEAVKNEV